jgi:hypothetical protein
MISFVIALGGLGSIFIASFYESTEPLLLVEYFGLAMATGTALVISVVGVLTLLNIPLTGFSVSTALLTGCGVSILGFLIKKPQIRIKRSSIPYQDLAENILPLSLFFALLILRLVQLRDIFVPPGYDGIVHTALLQEAAEGSDLSSYSIFQIGFPAVSLVIHSLWNLTPAETILLTTQWLGAVCGLSFYIFARRYIRNVYAAGLSFVVYAFLLLFPSALSAWGQHLASLASHTLVSLYSYRIALDLVFVYCGLCLASDRLEEIDSPGNPFRLKRSFPAVAFSSLSGSDGRSPIDIPSFSELSSSREHGLTLGQNRS